MGNGLSKAHLQFCAWGYFSSSEKLQDNVIFFENGCVPDGWYSFLWLDRVGFEQTCWINLNQMQINSFWTFITLLWLSLSFCFIPDFLGNVTAFLWLLPSCLVKSLKLRSISTRKGFIYKYILYSIKECLEPSYSNVDVAIITPFYDFVKEFTVWKLVCIFV